MEGRKLKPEVAEKYQVLKGNGVGEYYFNGHAVHLDRIGIDQADELVKIGFPYLVPLEEVKAESGKIKASAKAKLTE